MDNLQNRNETNLGTSSTGTFSGDWNRDLPWWRENYRNRPYATADRGFDDYEPGYRYAYQSINRYKGKSWNQVEPDLRSGWNSFEGRGNSTWDNIKDAVRDAWDNLTGKF